MVHVIFVIAALVIGLVIGWFTRELCIIASKVERVMDGLRGKEDKTVR